MRPDEDPSLDLALELDILSKETPFRQGRLLTFNQNTGANTVDVGGAVLIDVPLLNIGDTVNLEGDDALGPGNGNIVVVMKMRSSWAIMGRVVAVGSAQLAVASVATEIKTDDGENFAVTVADVAVAATSNFTIPVWANKCDVMMTGVVNARNSTATVGFLYARSRFTFASGNNTSSEQHVSAPANVAPFINQPSVATTHAATISGAIGLQTFTAQMLVSTDATTGNWAASTQNFAHISAIAVYTRTP